MRRLALLIALVLIGAVACSQSADRGTASGSRATPTTYKPSPSALASAFMFNAPDGSTFARGEADLYNWDGSFLRTIKVTGNLLVSHDGHYFVIGGTGELWNTTGQKLAIVPDWQFFGGGWAADADILCGSGRGAAGLYDLVTVDTTGFIQRFTFRTPGDLHNVFGCSVGADRAAVLEGGNAAYRMSIVSLNDGHLERTVELGSTMQVVAVSSDVGWMAKVTSQPGGALESGIVNLSDGTIGAILQGAYVIAFTPDGKDVLVNNASGSEASILDWRTKTKMWSVPGHVETVMDSSDPATNEMLVAISTGSTAAGTETLDYWIVSGTGAATSFKPRYQTR